MSPIKLRNFVQRLHFKNKVEKLIVRYLYILLLIPIFFYSYPIIESGISITGDFPYLDTPDYAKDTLWMWFDKGSRDGFEFVTRFSIIGLWYVLSFINVTTELATKLMVVLGFFLSSFCFYFSFLLFFKNKLTGSYFKLKISAVIGSLLYAYNVWSFDRIHHWYLWIGYSILPLFFISIFFSFKNPKNWKYLLASTFLWSFASTTPHMAIFYSIILVGTFLAFIFNDLYNKKKPKIQLAVPLFSIIFFYSLVNMYWIYPFTLSSQIRTPNPPFELTTESLELLSRESNFLNSTRIMGYWLNSDVEKPDHQLLFSLWLFSSFVIPIVAFSALFLKKSIKYALFFSSVALVVILLSMGTQSPFDYYKLALSIPILSKFVWVFRDADKWSFLIAFAYSFLTGLVSYKILILIGRRKNTINKKSLVAGVFIFLLIGSIFLSSYPFYRARMDPLEPVLLPSEFDKLNAYLSTINTDKVYFMPYPLKETEWDRRGVVQNIYGAHSIKPTIDSSQDYSIPSNYYNYVVSTIMENRSKNISNLINPLGTSYVVYHNDTWNNLQDSYDTKRIDLLKKLYFLGDLKNVNNIGFYKIFKTSNNNSSDVVREVNIPYTNIAALGGLDILASLNVVPSFNSLQSSILFLDDIHIKNTHSFMKGFNELILDRSASEDELALSFIDDKYLIAPFYNTFSNDPSHVWSNARARDPIHADFHPYLKDLGIENWDFDYGKGLVETQAIGANISIPIEIEDKDKNNGSKDSTYDLFMRYFKNQKGGPIKVYVDDKLVNEIDTFDEISNKFILEKVASVNLTKGKHRLTLENVAGFNAVNIFALIPSEELNKLRTESAHLLAEKIRVLYLTEAESNFYNSMGKETGSSIHLFKVNTNNVTIDDNNSTFTKNFTGQFKVPKNTDLVALEFIRTNHKNESSFSIKNVEIAPAYKKYYLFTSDFERKKNSVPLATLRHLDWLNYDRDLISTSTETNMPLDGKESLRVNLKQGDKVGWNTLSTDLIPIDDEAYYNASLEVSANDVKQFHSKILYFDSKKNEMDAVQYILDGKDGTFEDTFSKAILPPKGAKYIKYQVLAKSANPVPSHYILDNVKLEEIIFPNRLRKNFVDNLDKYSDQNLMIVNKSGSLEQKLKGNSTNAMMTTKPFDVKEDHIYNYKVTAEAKNVSSYSAIASFRTSSDVSENSTRYGNNASNGRVLSLSPGSEISTRLDIIKASNYTIGLRANTCPSCTFLKVSMQEVNNDPKSVKNNMQDIDISLRNNNSELKWLNTNKSYPLKKGMYELKIYSQSQADLDSVVIHPIDNNNPSGYSNNKIHDQTLEALFTLGKNSSQPAHISEYKKINPTKYTLNIKNATRPYILAFAESYDPLWAAYVETGNGSTKSDSHENNYENNNFKTNNIPLYALTNGFYVNKTGDYTLVIEYQPQIWFIQGLTVSTLSLAGILIAFIFARKKFMIKLANRINRKTSTSEK
jgi:hypothetical protein